MIQWLDKLNLQPHEKRVVVVVMTILFLVANYLFVWPRLGSSQPILSKTSELNALADLYDSHQKSIPAEESEVRKLKANGETILKPDQSSLFLSTLQSEAAKASLNIMQTRNLGSGAQNSTNAFNEERAIMINFATGDSNLVEFMHAMSQPGSVLRIQSFDLGPEAPAQTRLSGSMTLIGNIEKATPPPSTSNIVKVATSSSASKATPGTISGKTTPSKTSTPKSSPVPLNRNVPNATNSLSKPK